MELHSELVAPRSLYSLDGTVEAVEGPGGYQLGVQFHPEDLRHSDRRFQRLFDRLVESAVAPTP